VGTGHATLYISAMADRSRCPNCGERVSPYAAGCAICGADLDTRRWDSGPTKAKQAGSWLSALTSGRTLNTPLWLVVVIIFFGGTILTAVVALFARVFG
jgi:uncharacterized protein (DUF983 family)